MRETCQTQQVGTLLRHVHPLYCGFLSWATRRLFFASSKFGSMANALWQASIALSHCFNLLYAAQILLWASAESGLAANAFWAASRLFW